MECTVSFPISICSSFQTLKSLEACYWFWDVFSVCCVFHAATSYCQEKKKTQLFQDLQYTFKEKKDVCKPLQFIYNPLGMLELKEIAIIAIVGIDLCRADSCLPGIIQPLHTEIQRVKGMFIHLLVYAQKHQIITVVCLACCDFICRQCSHWIRSDRFCAGNCTSACHAPLLQQSTTEPSCVIPQLYFLFPSVCHSIVSWIM